MPTWALPLAARCHAGSRQSGHRERAQADSPRAIARSRPPSKRALVSKHLHMMFRNQTGSSGPQFLEYFETSSSANLPKGTGLFWQAFDLDNGNRFVCDCERAFSPLERRNQPTVTLLARSYGVVDVAA